MAVFYVDSMAQETSESNFGSEKAPFRTIGEAVDHLRPGDTLYVKAGEYFESLQLTKGGSREAGYVTIRSFGDDTVTLTGAVRVGTEGWTMLSEGTYACQIPERLDPYAHDKSRPRAFCNGMEIPLRQQVVESEVNQHNEQGLMGLDLPDAPDDPRYSHTPVKHFEIDRATNTITIYCPGYHPAELKIEVSVLRSAFLVLGEYFRIQGFRIFGYAGAGIHVEAPHALVEYNYVEACGTGILLADDVSYESIVRRNTIMRSSQTGLHWKSRGCTIEDNSVVQSCTNSIIDTWSGGLKSNAGGWSLIRNNVVVGTGKHRVPGSCHAWGALWGDILAKCNMFTGNTVHGNEWVGIYVEWGQDGQQIQLNTSSRNFYGLCFRGSNYAVVMRNVFAENVNSLGFFSPRTEDNFVNGSKTMVEMAAVSNATGLVPEVRGMHGPKCVVEDLTKVFCPRSQGGILGRTGVVDYAIGDIHPGVFVIVTTDNRRIIEGLVQRDMGNGPNYLLYRPYHLCSIETPLTAAQAVIYGEPTMKPRKRLTSECIAVAKTDLKAGTVLDGIGGYCYRGSIDLHETAKKERFLPLGLAKGAKLKTDVAIDQVITYDMVDLPESVLLQLRRIQDTLMS